MELRREQVALAKAVESTIQDKVSIIEAITRDDQEILTAETVGRILGIFSGLVESECSWSPDTLTQTRPHELLTARSCVSRPDLVGAGPNRR